jgi:hypothetical protein
MSQVIDSQRVRYEDMTYSAFWLDFLSDNLNTSRLAKIEFLCQAESEDYFRFVFREISWEL